MKPEKMKPGEDPTAAANRAVMLEGLPEEDFVTAEEHEYEDSSERRVASEAVSVKKHFWKWGWCRWVPVPSVEDVFAPGNCAGFLEETGMPVLPALAQVAERQGKFLVELFNRIGKMQVRP